MNIEQELSDQQQIVATTIAMAVLADKREWDALTTIFTDEVWSDYTALNSIWLRITK